MTHVKILPRSYSLSSFELMQGRDTTHVSNTQAQDGMRIMGIPVTRADGI